ncbi:hypothetical protein COCSADRAFT_163328 [Bipolaris sorokiniana ND90Pr]|uniref:Uncharacterized protein n=1 Tax=Cochliobolus sativus (strain ND90Pr / ATCC 201652) TaxID=665912 RepID=M2SEM3_COCSN|nr:uncharacterized protein COCSADRAFT_163328 [Bipolaris sorokiniana ND90Pr]EMD60910.1 hypothetical protein COCSADRAFT_163328 [Bipolaris sorokiniana ND90Pr]
MSPTVAFLTTFAPLPATTPSSHAHIINDFARGTSTPHLQDAIVTLLYNVSPSTLSTFLEPDIKEFRLVQTRRQGRDAGEELIVMKRSRKVIVGLATHSPDLFDTLEFDNLVRLEINAEGAWKVMYASYRDYFCDSWDDVWDGRTVNRGWDCLSLRAWVEDKRLESRKQLEILAEELMWAPINNAFQHHLHRNGPLHAPHHTNQQPATSNSNTENYTIAFPTLPPNTPETHAHTINLLTPPAHPSLQDTLVTTLFQVSPSTLSRFLGPTVHTFKEVLGEGG